MEALNPGLHADAWAGGSHWRDRPSLSLGSSQAAAASPQLSSLPHDLHPAAAWSNGAGTNPCNLARLKEETLPPPEPRMTLEEARATMWLRENHRPMGELLDELGNLYQDHLVDEATQARIVEKLKRLGKKWRR